MSISQRLDDCKDHEWADLEEEFFGLLKSHMVDYPGIPINKQLEDWCDRVDHRHIERLEELRRVKEAEEIEMENGTYLEDE